MSADSGMITFVRNGEVVMKVISGIGGRNVIPIGKRMQDRWPISGEEAYEMAMESSLGNKYSLVVMTKDDIIYRGYDYPCDLYRESFELPDFCPRVLDGKIDNVEIVNV